MIAELLAMLAGHPSSLFASSSTAPSATAHGAPAGPLKIRDDLDFLHPSEVDILNHLATYSTRYVRIKLFADAQIEAARQRAVRAALRANTLSSRSSTTSGKDALSELEQQPTLHLVPLCSTLLSILSDYHALVLETERLVLDNHLDLVARNGFVSLANLRARFEPWDAPLTALDELVTLLVRGPSRGRDAAFALETTEPTQPRQAESDGAAAFPAAWTGGLLIDLLSLKASTGVERVAAHMARLRSAVEDSWMQHLVAWVCRGEIHRPGGIADPNASKRTLISRDQLVHWIHATEADAHTDHAALAPGDGLADWAATATNTWAFRQDALPSAISDSTADSILYVGRALYTIRSASTSSMHSGGARSGPGRPSGPPDAVIELHEANLARVNVRPSRPSDLDRAIQSLRNDVSEWIFRNILTTSLVLSSLRCLGDYFLHRNGPYILSLLEEVETMRKNKLYRARSAAASVIRSSDLELALRRATVGTWAEDDPALERLRFVLPRGGYRPSLAGARTAKVRGTASSTASSDNPTGAAAGAARFDDYLIGVPAQLHYTAVFPLDLFLSPADLAAYSRVFSYLIAIKKIHARVLECWVALSKNQRGRRKFTGTGEGGVDAHEERQRAHLLRCTCGVVRSMKWFLDTLLGHFQTDIIDTQYASMIEQLSASVAPAVAAEAGVPMAASRSATRVRKDSEQLVASSPVASAAPSEAYGEGGRPRVGSGSAMGLSRPPTVVAGSVSGGAARHRRLAFPVSGPASSAYPTPATGRAGRRFVSSSTRPESVADGAETVHADMDGGIEDDAGVLDFGLLRASHTAFLAYVQDGLLLSSPVASSLVRSVLEICNRFVGAIERWGGDVLPPLLGESTAAASAQSADPTAVVRERQKVVDAAGAELAAELERFFRLLSSSSSGGYQAGGANVSTLAGTLDETGIGSLSISVAQLAMPRDKLDWTSSSSSSAKKHLEQLLLRLDYSGFFAGQAHTKPAPQNPLETSLRA